MRNFFENMRAGIMMTAIACLIFGVIVLVYPATSMTIVCRVVGGIILLTGAGFVIGYFKGENKRFLAKIGVGIGVILSVVGGFILLFPQKVLAIVPVIFGIILVYHGLTNAKQSWDLRSYDDERWWILLLIAVSNVVLGILIMKNPFGSMKLLIRILSICLIYDGISSAVLAVHYVRTIRKHPKLIAEENERIGEIEVIEGDYKEL